jgi:hypothetical protein
MLSVISFKWSFVLLLFAIGGCNPFKIYIWLFLSFWWHGKIRGKKTAQSELNGG